MPHNLLISKMQQEIKCIKTQYEALPYSYQRTLDPLFGAQLKQYGPNSSLDQLKVIYDALLNLSWFTKWWWSAELNQMLKSNNAALDVYALAVSKTGSSPALALESIQWNDYKADIELLIQEKNKKSWITRWFFPRSLEAALDNKEKPFVIGALLSNLTFLQRLFFPRLVAVANSPLMQAYKRMQEELQNINDEHKSIIAEVLAQSVDPDATLQNIIRQKRSDLHNAPLNENDWYKKNIPLIRYLLTYPDLSLSNLQALKENVTPFTVAALSNHQKSNQYNLSHLLSSLPQTLLTNDYVNCIAEHKQSGPVAWLLKVLERNNLLTSKQEKDDWLTFIYTHQDDEYLFRLQRIFQRYLKIEPNENELTSTLLPKLKLHADFLLDADITKLWFCIRDDHFESSFKLLVRMCENSNSSCDEKKEGMKWQLIAIMQLSRSPAFWELEGYDKYTKRAIDQGIRTSDQLLRDGAHILFKPDEKSKLATILITHMTERTQYNKTCFSNYCQHESVRKLLDFQNRETHGLQKRLLEKAKEIQGLTQDSFFHDHLQRARGLEEFTYKVEGVSDIPSSRANALS